VNYAIFIGRYFVTCYPGPNFDYCGFRHYHCSSFCLAKVYFAAFWFPESFHWSAEHAVAAESAGTELEINFCL